MWRRGRTWYLKRELPGIGRVYKSLSTTRVAHAREREELLLGLAERGHLESRPGVARGPSAAAPTRRGPRHGPAARAYHTAPLPRRVRRRRHHPLSPGEGC